MFLETTTTTTKSAVELIEKLAEKLGTTAEHVYSVMVRQATVEGIKYTVIATFFLVVAMLILTTITRILKKDSEMLGYKFDDFDRCVWTIVGGVLLIFSVGFTGAFAGDAMTAFLNPEY